MNHPASRSIYELLMLSHDDDDIGFTEEQMMSDTECEEQEWYEMMMNLGKLPLSKQESVAQEIYSRLGQKNVLEILRLQTTEQ